LSLQVGQYCQVHEEDNPRNIQLARTKGVISLEPSGNPQGGIKFMALKTGKKIVHRSWDIIPMPDLVIARVNSLGSNEPHQMRFTDRYGRLIGDIEIPGVDSNEDKDDNFPGVAPVIEDYIKIPGVDVVGQYITSPKIVENNDLDIPQDEPATIEVAPTQAVKAPETPAQVALPANAPGLRRYTRVRSQDKPGYAPSMTGSKYSYAVTHLERQGVLNPDAHMFVQDDFYQAEPDVVEAIMIKLSLKAGLKEWGEKSFMAAQSEMKQLQL
jgi:hypothetical protein